MSPTNSERNAGRPSAPRMGAEQVGARLRTGQERDWFSVDGTVAPDDDQVLEIRFLLELLDKAQGRFVEAEDGRFVALIRQLQAQLQRLSAVSEQDNKAGRRVQALGAPSLEAVLEEAGAVNAHIAS